MGAAQHCSLNMPSLPLNYVEYDNSLFPSTFMFSTERFPPKYEDAIKLPSATPRRSSCSAIPPPFYDTSTITIEAANGKSIHKNAKVLTFQTKKFMLLVLLN